MATNLASLTDLESLEYLVVGAGFYGSVIAERIASELGKRVVVIDKRNHFGGNSYSYLDGESGIEIHKYGSHIFHTSNEKVWKYVNRFSSFNTYQHRVLTTHKNRVYSMPINLMTINSFYNKNLRPAEAVEFVKTEIAREFVKEPKNLEEKAISLIGRPMYEAFIKGYTQKQWGTEPTSLPANIITRLPVRYTYNDRYFSDTYEGIPCDGYGKLFAKLLDHPLISLALGTDFFEIRNHIPLSCKIIYTGPIDKYFNFKFGALGWRTSDFEMERHNCESFQGTSVMNYPDLDIPYTRIHEFKHFHPEKTSENSTTVIFKEYSRFAGPHDTPYYPINTEADKQVFAQYKQEAEKEKNVIFGGRLGNYVYIDMHQAIAMALNTFETKLRNQKS